MDSLLRLCKAIINKNKGFTFGIFIMSIFTVAIGFLGANFTISSENTINNFLKISNMPEAIYVSEIIDDDVSKLIEDIDGVNLVTKRFVFDSNIETTDGNIYSVRIYRQDSNSPYKHTIHSKSNISSELPKISISKEFAEYNNINVSDLIYINTIQGKSHVIVDAIISNPETMNCQKDFMSSYEGYQFGYIYIDKDDFNKIIDIGDNFNQLLVYFDSDLDVEQQKECMAKISQLLGENLISETLFSESEEFNTIRDDLNTISIICKFIPGIIWFISLGFNFIFFKIIVENQRKNIGLLRALGYSSKKVIFIFILYTIIINIPALIIGDFLGYELLRICVGIIASSKEILDIVITILPLKTIIMSLAIFVIGIIAALLSSNNITNIDPSETYAGKDNIYSDPPELISKFNTDTFIKISISSLLRNYKRQLIGCLCISACIISTCIGLHGIKSIRYPIDAVYGDRYKYDLMIRNINSNIIEKIINEISGIETSEKIIEFEAKMFDKNVRVSTISRNSKLVELKNANGEILYPNDGAIIDEMTAKINNISVGDTIKLDNHEFVVSGIAREILHTIVYISEDTANILGYSDENCILLSFNDGIDLNSVENQISNFNNDAYFVEFNLQKANINDAFVPMSTFMLVFAILAFLIGSIIVINFTIIDFNENINKYSILRAIGTPVKRLAKVSIIQNSFRVLIGIIIAIPLSYICNLTLLELLSGPSQQYVMVDYSKCFIISCFSTLLYVVFGTILSLYKIKKLDFVDKLNEME